MKQHYIEYSWEKDISTCGLEVTLDINGKLTWRGVDCKKCLKERPWHRGKKQFRGVGEADDKDVSVSGSQNTF